MNRGCHPQTGQADLLILSLNGRGPVRAIEPIQYLGQGPAAARPPLPMPRAESAVQCLVPIVHHRPERIRPVHVVLRQQRWFDPNPECDAPESRVSPVSRRSYSIDGLERSAVVGKLPGRLWGYFGRFVAVGSDRNVLAGQGMTIGEIGRWYASSGGRGYERARPRGTRRDRGWRNGQRSAHRRPRASLSQPGCSDSWR